MDHYIVLWLAWSEYVWINLIFVVTDFEQEKFNRRERDSKLTISCFGFLEKLRF